jgi:cobalt transporter subunit CbtA
MLRQILASAVIAGALAGILVSGLQAIRVVPLILEAETYESLEMATEIATALHSHDTSVPGHDHGGSIDETGIWAPEEGLERIFYTALSNILTATAFALLLTACYALVGHVDWRRGMLWGLAGFAVFHLAPSLGLPPEVPGSTAAPLYDRQAWWFGTVVATAGGLALLVFYCEGVAKVLGVVLLALPHLIGAPQLEIHGDLAPPELTSQFVVAALVTAGIFWAFLGAVSGFLFHRMEGRT